MKKRSLFLGFIFVIASLQAQSDTLHFDPATTEGDSVEYELIVIDPGYESFLISQPSAAFYSQQYYESWNQRYVQEWNYRYLQPLVYGDLYETYVDYDHFVNYGLELNYRLYYYFRFFEKKNLLSLLPERTAR